MQSGSTTPATTQESTQAHWTQAEESVFLEFLQDHNAESGDGLNFKGAAWSGVADTLSALCKIEGGKGGAKTPLACKNKWTSVSSQ